MKILHLYYDIMNLYGEYANVLALERLLRANSIDVTTDKITLDEKADISVYDFIYIGSGTERNQKVVLENLKQYAEDLKTYTENGKTALLTGNSFEMLGKTITDSKGKIFDGIGLSEFETTEQNKKRMTADAIFSADFSDKKLVGFINKSSSINNVDTPLFSVEMGIGNNDNDKKEGIRINNLFGTHLTGPVLMKNPYFLEYIAGLIIGTDKKLNTDHLYYEKAGYEVTLSELTRRASANQ